MRKIYRFTLAIAIMFAMFVSTASIAQQHVINMNGGPLKKENWMKAPAEAPLNEDHSKNWDWITKWYGPDGNYENSSGVEVSAPKDLIKEGTNGRLTQLGLSTEDGLWASWAWGRGNIDIQWKKKHGGIRDWTVFELDPADAHHMNRDGPGDNIDTYGIIVIGAPWAMKSVMSPAHDDHAQIWINGEKWYNNPLGTGDVTQVDYNVEIQLQIGSNILVYRCSQSAGPAYMNLHFDDFTHSVCEIYPDKSRDQNSFFREAFRIV